MRFQIYIRTRPERLFLGFPMLFGIDINRSRRWMKVMGMRYPLLKKPGEKAKKREKKARPFYIAREVLRRKRDLRDISAGLLSLFYRLRHAVGFRRTAIEISTTGPAIDGMLYGLSFLAPKRGMISFHSGFEGVNFLLVELRIFILRIARELLIFVTTFPWIRMVRFYTAFRRK